MSNIAINRVTNANVYMDGGSQLGKVEEATLPTVKMKMASHKALGMVGDVEFPVGIEKLEMKLKWNSFYRDALVKAANPFKAVQIQLRTNVESYDSTGRSAQVPAIIFATAQFKDFPLGGFKQHDNVELESNLSVTACKMIVDGVTILDLDILANIYKVNGVDMLATYRANLGA